MHEFWAKMRRWLSENPFGSNFYDKEVLLANRDSLLESWAKLQYRCESERHSPDAYHNLEHALAERTRERDELQAEVERLNALFAK
jgi:hypothetical protein